MFDRITDRARKVMGLAREEALRLDHDYIGPEHLLLGLLQQSCTGTSILKSLGADLAAVQAAAEARIVRGQATETPGLMSFTSAAKTVLEQALEEASDLGHTYVGTEHLLLGLIRADDDVAGPVLRELQIPLDGAREALRTLLRAEPPDAEQASGRLHTLRAVLTATDADVAEVLLEAGVDRDALLAAVRRRIDASPPASHEAS